jgi:hypothetical protein
MPQYNKVFALRYNPFSLLGVLDLPNALGAELGSMPLQMAKNDRLVPFYSNDIYPATPKTGRMTPYDYFLSSMKVRGYSDGSGGQPKAVSPHGRVVLVRGEKGTGKTTLAHRMMRWLQSCGDEWRYVDWSGNGLNAEQQRASLEIDFKNRILDEGNGRFLCLVEDIRNNADERLIEIYPQILPGRTLCIFITTDDAELRKKTFGLFSPTVLICETRTLTADQAVAYCRQRISHARCDDAPSWIKADYPLFPLTEDIVRRCILPLKALNEYFDVPGSIGVRELNKVFGLLLEDTLGVDETFDVRGVPIGGAPARLIDPIGAESEAA